MPDLLLDSLLWLQRHPWALAWIAAAVLVLLFLRGAAKLNQPRAELYGHWLEGAAERDDAIYLGVESAGLAHLRSQPAPRARYQGPEESDGGLV